MSTTEEELRDIINKLKELNAKKTSEQFFGGSIGIGTIAGTVLISPWFVLGLPAAGGYLEYRKKRRRMRIDTAIERLQELRSRANDPNEVKMIDEIIDGFHLLEDQTDVSNMIDKKCERLLMKEIRRQPVFDHEDCIEQEGSDLEFF